MALEGSTTRYGNYNIEHNIPTSVQHLNGDDIVWTIRIDKGIEIVIKKAMITIWGYHRPITSYNVGKQSEFYSRKNFKEEKSLNSKFNEDYKIKEKD